MGTMTRLPEPNQHNNIAVGAYCCVSHSGLMLRHAVVSKVQNATCAWKHRIGQTALTGTIQAISWRTNKAAACSAFHD